MGNKKKIGIITYWESNDNYGQQLQCWALQHFLREQGYDAFLIRQYAWPQQWSHKREWSKGIKQFIKYVISRILYITHLAYKPYIYTLFSFCLDKDICLRQFPQYRQRNLKMSQIYDSPDKLRDNPPNADVYIAGSDQIWNYCLDEGPISNYFLQFGPHQVRRIAYAPSLGQVFLPDAVQERFKRYLRKFDSISVRESSSVTILKKLGYNTNCVLDPTMLLSADSYMQLLDGKGKKNECVFIYSMNYASADEIPFDAVFEYAKIQQLPIVVTPGSGYLPTKELFEGVEYSYATIPQWIQHILDAKLVITASFHGVVFAILFHRPFIYTPLKGELANGNNRVLDLLKDLGLQQYIIKTEYSIKDYVEIQTNWQEVDNKLNELRKKSILYLFTAIENE